MDLFYYVLVLMLVFDNADAVNFGYDYRSYQSLAQVSRPLLMQCVKTRFEESIGIVFDSVNNTCTKLTSSWLTDQQTVEGNIYLLKVISDEKYVPPKYFYGSIEEEGYFIQSPPMVLQDGSKLEMYISSSNANNQFIIVLKKSDDYLMKATIQYVSSTMLFQARYNNVWSHYSFVLTVPFAINKVEKFSFLTIGSGIEVYHDDQLLITFKDPSSPHDVANTDAVNIWLGIGSHINLHRIVYTK